MTDAAEAMWVTAAVFSLLASAYFTITGVSAHRRRKSRIQQIKDEHYDQ